MATVRENLIAARALIDTPEKWIKGSFEESGCFCITGALGMAEKGKARLFSDGAYEALCKGLPAGRVVSLPYFNDHPDTTHPMILAVFDRAIAAQEPQP